MLSGLEISFQNLNHLHSDQIVNLKSFFDQSLLTGLIEFGSSVDEAMSPSLTEGTCFRERERERERERKREKEGCLSGVANNLLALCCRGAGCLSGVATYLRALCCRGACGLNGVGTYQPAMCCRDAAV